VTIAWSLVPDATESQIYGRTPGGAAQYWTVAAPTFTDTGAPGMKGTPPSEGTRWQVKNLFELKNASRAKIEYNLFENNWQAAQPGYAIVLTPRNQGGGCAWCVLQSVELTHNIVRNTAAGVNILGYDTNSSSQQTAGIRIVDNLFLGVTTRLGGNGWGILIGDEPRDVVIDHNTFDLDGTTILYAYGGSEGAPGRITGFQFTNNAARHGTYGINGASASTGNLTLRMYFPGAVLTGNWLSGGDPSKYPAGNRFDVPFDAGVAALKSGAGAAHPSQAGADVAKLLPLFDAIPKGLMTGEPQPPRSLPAISSAK
jgi:hypothetical protein